MGLVLYLSIFTRQGGPNLQKKIGVFGGSFDPLTYGHLNLIERSSRLFDEVIVLIAVNTSKEAVFTIEERQRLIKEVTQHLENVKIDTLTDGLIAHYYQSVHATSLIRGVRSGKDFEYEASIASVNQTQVDQLETVLLLADDKYRYISSSLIKEIAYFGGDVTQMVPPNVSKALREKFNSQH